MLNAVIYFAARPLTTGEHTAGSAPWWAQHHGGLSTTRVPGAVRSTGPHYGGATALAFDAANKFTNFPGFQLAFPPAPSL